MTRSRTQVSKLEGNKFLETGPISLKLTACSATKHDSPSCTIAIVT